MDEISNLPPSMKYSMERTWSLLRHILNHIGNTMEENNLFALI
jgi:hypothetical protein